MDRDVNRFTRNRIFDEKMGDTVHLAVGTAHDHTVPEDRTATGSRSTSTRSWT
jgi:aminopeptidase